MHESFKKIFLGEKVFVNKMGNPEAIKKKLTELILFKKIINKVKREVAEWDKIFELYITEKKSCYPSS